MWGWPSHIIRNRLDALKMILFITSIFVFLYFLPALQNWIPEGQGMLWDDLSAKAGLSLQWWRFCGFPTHTIPVQDYSYSSRLFLISRYSLDSGCCHWMIRTIQNWIHYSAWVLPRKTGLLTAFCWYHLVIMLACPAALLFISSVWPTVIPGCYSADLVSKV